MFANLREYTTRYTLLMVWYDGERSKSETHIQTFKLLGTRRGAYLIGALLDDYDPVRQTMSNWFLLFCTSIIMTKPFGGSSSSLGNPSGKSTRNPTTATNEHRGQRALQCLLSWGRLVHTYLRSASHSRASSISFKEIIEAQNESPKAIASVHHWCLFVQEVRLLCLLKEMQSMWWWCKRVSRLGAIFCAMNLSRNCVWHGCKLLSDSTQHDLQRMTSYASLARWNFVWRLPPRLGSASNCLLSAYPSGGQRRNR